MEAAGIKALIKDANQTFVDNNIEAFLVFCTENVVWTLVGTPSFIGKDAIRKAMSGMENMVGQPEINTDQILVEGNRAVCTGTMKMQQKDGVQHHSAFSDVYLFEGDKILELNSYIVNLKKD